MTDTVLGLDIGPNSIGWALVNIDSENEGQIVATGVRVFPEGVDRDQQGGEKSKNQSRRDARAIRRQITRRTRRLKRLQELLTRVGLLPSDPNELSEVMSNNPYPLRAKSATEQVTPYEIGRIFMHLAQRRGFLSNRKTDRKDNETKGMLGEISELQQTIDNTPGCKTLGQYLAMLDGEFDHTSSDESQRVRGRHTRRDMYEHEFLVIWETQRKFHSDVLTDALKNKLYDPSHDGKWMRKGLMFGQRRMYWPKSMIGLCDLERKEKRCAKADRTAQKFRLLQEVNNLRFPDPETGEERGFNDEEYPVIVEYLLQGKERTFDQIRKKLKFPENLPFSLERAERKKLLGHVTDASLSAKKAIGNHYNTLAEHQKDAIVDILLNEDREDVAFLQLMNDCGLTREQAEGALSVNLPAGHVNYSRKAIDKLLPHLERRLRLMANDENDSALHAAGYLRPDQREVNQQDKLPPAPDLPNPIVRQAMVEVRKVVNTIIREFGLPTSIHVELAREAKCSLEDRTRIRMDNAKRRRHRESLAAKIEEANHKPSRRTINRLLLWEEQEEYCPYCAEKISYAQLFNGESDIDHILPRWRSLDDSLANKVIAHRKCNHAKGDQTPCEWLENADPAAFDKMMRIVAKLPYNKQRKFNQQGIDLNDFVARQLVDTAYISRAVSQYLRCLGVTIVCPRGHMTAELRHWWGLNNILDPKKLGRKNRDDHRHHAIDAIVLALTNHKRLHALANARGKNMPAPWKDFRKEAEKHILAINVSHRTQRQLRGALHEDTLYGPTQKIASDKQHDNGNDRPWAKDWIEDKKSFVRRKPITEVKNMKHLGKIRDKVIRKILIEHLQALSVDTESDKAFPKDVFKGDNTPHMPSGVPIRRVRMIEKSETFRQVSEKRRPMQYVKPGNNHHIIYYAIGSDDNEKWTADVVTMWDAAKRARTKDANGKYYPAINHSDKEDKQYIYSLSMGEMFIFDDEQGIQRLCVVRKLNQNNQYIYYKIHTDARKAGDINKDNLYLSPEQMRKLKARKVTVDPVGRIRWADNKRWAND